MQHINNLPQDDDGCGWFNTLPQPGPVTELQGHRRVKRVVVGAGFTGLACARQLALLCPDEEIVLIDAQRVAEGASGRNMGFVIDLPHKGDLASNDTERKLKIMRLNRLAIAQLESLVQTHGIDCQWSRAGKFQGAVGSRGVAFLEHFEALLKEVGEPYTVYDRRSAAEILGTSYYERATYTPGCILMQPAALVRGLAEHLPSNVSLFENSPVLRIERSDGLFKLSTRYGSITADQLLLCTEAFTEEFGYMQRRLLPIMTFASMTRPLTLEEQAQFHGKYDWGLTPADHGGTTVRMTQDKRLLIRNSYEYVPQYFATPAKREEVRARHRDGLQKRYPALAKVPFEHTWGGLTCLSRDFTAFFGKVDEGVYGAFCHNGVGVARGTITGKLLADLVVGATSQDLTDMHQVSGVLPRNPPEPLLGIGVRARLKLSRWVSRHEL